VSRREHFASRGGLLLRFTRMRCWCERYVVKPSFFHRHGSKMYWGIILLVMFIYLMPIARGVMYRTGLIAEPETVNWRTDFKAALAEAEANGRLVLLDFTASWCPPCQTMKHEVWPDEAVRQAVEAEYVPVLLDIDEPGPRRLAERYGVGSIPTIIVTDAQGNELRRGQYMSARKMVGFLGKRE